MTLGPVEYLLIGFPGNRFKGDIVPALADLVESDTIRILDLVFVKKDADGSISVFEYDALDETSDVAQLDGEPAACSMTRTSRSRPRRSSPTARLPCWCGKTGGRRRWRMRSTTPAAC